MAASASDAAARPPLPGIVVVTGRPAPGGARSGRAAGRAHARLLAAQAVAGAAGTDATGVTFSQRCDACGGRHGRPAVTGEPGVSVSWAHSRGLVAAAASARFRVGVDCEPLTTGLVAGELAAALSVRELAFARDATAALHVWTRKEALVKLTGRGVAEMPLLDLVGPSGRLRDRLCGVELRSWVECGHVVAVAFAPSAHLRSRSA